MSPPNPRLLGIALASAFAFGVTRGGSVAATLRVTDSARRPASFLCPETADERRAVAETAIDCAVDGGRFASGAPAASELVVMSYNLQRGGRWREQAALLAGGSAVPRPDILLLSEADRGCSRTDGVDVARALAGELSMDYAFAVEFIELPRRAGAGGRLDSACEHGNAVLSRFPIEGVTPLRHAITASWYAPPGLRRLWGEPRLGGRVALGADIRVGPRTLRVYSVHFESSPFGGVYRAAQAAELLAHASSFAGPVVIGGDMNWHGYGFDLAFGTALDPAPAAFARQGFWDARRVAGVPLVGTHGPLLLDVVFGRGLDVTGAGSCAPRECDRLSDHRPVWARVRLP